LGLGNITERYSYLASVGFAILVVIVIDKVLALVRDNNYKVVLLAINNLSYWWLVFLPKHY